jgi:hypothetical protein
MTEREHPLHGDRDERLPAYAPGWTEGNIHDPGIMLLSLFAFLGATLLWQSGRREGAASGLSRLAGVGLGVVSAAGLLRLCWRRR